MIRNCQFEQRPQDGLWQCTQCDYVYKFPLDKPPIRNCPNAPDLVPFAERLAKETGDPGIVEKIGHYATAFRRWAASGFKTRSKEEVARIHTEHCRPCEKFDVEADACRVCGCNVRVGGMAARNKAAMATEKCPLDKW